MNRKIVILLITLIWSSRVFCNDVFNAVRDDDLEKVKALLKASPDLISNKVDYGFTTLGLAAQWGRKDVVEWLLTNKADVNVKDSIGFTPLESAAESWHKDIVELLLSHKAEVNTKSNNGWTPLHQVMLGFAFPSNEPTNSPFEVAKLLLEHKAEVNARNDDGITPLHLAAKRGYKNVGELLLAYGSDVNAKDNNGHTPLHSAAYGGSKNVAELLLAHSADINAKDNNGNTPLHLAMLPVELDMGSSSSVETTSSPSYLARLRDRKDVAEWLRQHGGHE